MIRFNAAPAFNFDEWAALYQRDPQAFEARRKAVLAIEVARSGRHAQQARELVDRLDLALEGKSEVERMNLSMLAMATAASQLAQGLQNLVQAIDQHTAYRADPTDRQGQATDRGPSACQRQSGRQSE